MKRTHILLIAIVFVAGVGAVYWRSSAGRVQPVNVTQLEYADLYQSIDTNGKVEAERNFELRAPFAGICRQILVREGAQLRPGQPVVVLDDASLRSELAAAKAELETAQAELRNIVRGPAAEELNQSESEAQRHRLELENAKKILETNEWLLKRNAISQFEVEQSRRDVERAQQAVGAAITHWNDIKARYNEGDRRRGESRVEAAQSRIQFLQTGLERSVVRAPAGGTLYHFEVKDGAYVNTGDLLGVLADISQLRVRAYIDEPDLGRVNRDAQVTIRWDAHPGEVWTGKVRYIPSEIVARGARSVAEVLCSIDKPIRMLIPNTNVDVEIAAPDGDKVASLPRNTIFGEGKSHFVWAIRNGHATKSIVETGRSTAGRVEFTSGLKADDRVIIPGEAPITEGMRVRVEPE